MREIKFRAWDPIRSEMDFFDLRSYDDNRHDDYGTTQQYTCLKDKNGVEIYEGDILSDGRVSFDVCQVNDRCGMKIGGYRPYDIVRNPWCLLEVIGNIYQNPELLKS